MNLEEEVAEEEILEQRRAPVMRTPPAVDDILQPRHIRYDSQGDAVPEPMQEVNFAREDENISVVDANSSIPDIQSFNIFQVQQLIDNAISRAIIEERRNNSTPRFEIGGRTTTTPFMADITQSRTTPGGVFFNNANEDKKVSSSKFLLTSQIDIETIKQNKISQTTNNVRQKLENLTRAYTSCGLDTLFTTRKMPSCTLLNKNGYVGAKVYQSKCAITGQDIFDVCPEDDIFLYRHDMKRLFTIVNVAFDQGLLYLVQNEKISGDGVSFHNKMVKHFLGHEIKDISKARDELFSFNLDLRVPLAAEIARLYELIASLEYAQVGPVSENEKMAITKAFLKDTREGMNISLHFTRNNKYNFDETMHHMLDAAARLSPSEAVVKMNEFRNNTTMKDKLYCFKFQTGTCIFGNKCRYLHQIDPNFKSTESTYRNKNTNEEKKYDKEKFNSNDKFQHNENNSKQYIKNDVPSKYTTRSSNNRYPLTRDNRTPRSDPYVPPNTRFDSKPKTSIKSMAPNFQDANEQYLAPDPAFQSWQSANLRSFRSPHTVPENVRMNMFTETASTGEDAPHTPEPTQKNTRPVGSELILASPGMNMGDDENYKLDQATQAIRAYNEHCSNTIADWTPDIKYAGATVYAYYAKSMMETWETIAKRAVKIFVWFGWREGDLELARCMMSQRDDLLCGHQDFLRLINLIGGIYLGAQISLHSAQAQDETEKDIYMNFSPYGKPYVRPGNYGSYVSMSPDVDTICAKMERATCAEDNDDDTVPKVYYIEDKSTRVILWVACIYDFMAYSAQRLRKEIDVGVLEKDSRHEIYLEVCLAHGKYNDQYATDIFTAIIKVIQPIPVGSDSIKEEDFTPRKRIRSRKSTPIPSGSTVLSPAYLPESPIYPSPGAGCSSASASSSSSSSDPTATRLDYAKKLTVMESVRKMNMTQHSPLVIFDTGASRSGTSDTSRLRDITACDPIEVQGAFGPPITLTSKGLLGRLGLDTIVIPGMTDTLLSISQICKGGNTGIQQCAVFTSEGCRIFELESIRTALTVMDSQGRETLRAIERGGLYVHDEYFDIKTESLLVATVRPLSLWDQVHQVTGHPGDTGMAWHRKHSKNAEYTHSDAAIPRSVCTACAYGSSRQTGTDHLRDHRPRPTDPGCQFSLDAFAHTAKSDRGNVRADIFTDHASRMTYPIFCRDNSADALVEKANLLFNKHPEWKPNGSAAVRFIRVDPELNYQSQKFLQFCSDRGYQIERTPPRDKHAGGIAERTVGLITLKTNVAMLASTPRVPQKYWDYAMEYACITQGFAYNSVINTSPYHFLTGRHVDIKQLHPFFAQCYVYIPKADRKGKLGFPRAYKARFIGYSFTTIMSPSYIVIAVKENNNYGGPRISKDVIFDIQVDIQDDDKIPSEEDFQRLLNWQPEMVVAPEVVLPSPVEPPLPFIAVVPSHPSPPAPIIEPPANVRTDDTEDDINDVVEHLDKDGNVLYWYQLTVKNHEYPIVMVETSYVDHERLLQYTNITDPRIPKSYDEAVRHPLWSEAINVELTKFEKNSSLDIVDFDNQHLVPLKWIFNIKSCGTYKARLVGRGDLMLPGIDFDPNAVYCGNVSACSIKMALAIAASYKLTMRGGDLEGAYLVTRANIDYPVYIKTPKGYDIPGDKCIQAVGNLYGFPPAGQNFSKEFDKCVLECGYANTPWDLKFYYKWIDGLPLLLIVHSDDFRLFLPQSHLSEWDLLVQTFNAHGYKVTDATDKEFVGIRITVDEGKNYYTDQTRMIEEVLKEANMMNASGEKLPYPINDEPLTKGDSATQENTAKCSKYPYRRVVGQLMYGMVHTLVCIMYALNVLSRFCNNPGERHIKHLKHLLNYLKYAKDDRLKYHTHEGPTDIATMTALLQLRFQCDADLGGNKDNGHSQTSYLGYLGKSLICWCSTDQGSISTSTAESEIKAVNHTLKSEVIACRGQLNAMGWKQEPTVIEEDNSACVYASNNMHMTRNLRHLDLAQMWIKEKVADKTCILVKVDSKENNSDIGTKRVTLPIFQKLTSTIVDRSLRKNL